MFETSESLEKVLGEGPGTRVPVSCAQGTDGYHILINRQSPEGRVRAPSMGELATPGAVAGHLSSLPQCCHHQDPFSPKSS